MKKITVLHQILDPVGIGGVSAEYRALSKSSLSKKYDFKSMVLKDLRGGLRIKTIKYYYKRIRIISPDIIHIRGAAIDSLNAVIAAKLARKGKILVAVHGMYSDLVFISPFKRFLSQHLIEPLIFSLTDGISCVCHAASQRIKFKKYASKMLPFVYNRMPIFDFGDYGLIRTNIRIKYTIPNDAIVGVFAGRMTKEKGLQFLIEALKKFNSWPKKFHLLIVGDGDYKHEFENKAKCISQNIHCVGNKNNVRDFLFASDFFIMPSLHENHSIALLEAMAAKLPAICTNCGGNCEIIDNMDTGIIIPPRDSRELYSAINRMLDDEYREIISANISKHSFDAFSNEEVDKALDKVYTNLLNING